MVSASMIAARFFVSSPENSPPGSLFGHPTVITQPPHELVGQFLTAEIDSTRCPLFEDLPQALTEIASGQLPSYQGGGEGHLLAISKEGVRIDTLYAEPANVDEVPLADFRDLLDRWLAFVRKNEHGQK